jgi:hypothetical protein
MYPLDTRVRNFIGLLEFAADVSLQRDAWLHRAPGLTSVIDPGEMFCQFFDDTGLDQFIDEELASAPLSPEQKCAFLDVRAALAIVESSPFYVGKDVEALLRTPEWRALVEIATASLAPFQSWKFGANAV